MMPAAFAPFLDAAPLCVLARLAAQSPFDAGRLDALFRRVARRQYHKELLFSQVVELMMSVVVRTDDGVHAAYRVRRRAGTVTVSDQAVYDKLRNTEPDLSAALVADSAARLAPVIDALGARRPDWVRGYRTRVLDGNLLSRTQSRLDVPRTTWAAGLPGRVLAVYDPATDLVIDAVLTPDAHANERTLIGEVLTRVRANDLWVADRNFCTLGFLFGIAARKAKFVIRQHGTLVGQPVGRRRPAGRTATGRVFEQDVDLTFEGRTRRVRRVTVALDRPTRDGDAEIHILTNLGRGVPAARVAEVYRRRWTIEGRFLEMAQTLTAEPNTLGYPAAALFAFCLGLVASNAAALVRAAVRASHGAEAADGMSWQEVASEVRRTYAGMMVALPPTAWAFVGGWTTAELAAALRSVAERVRPDGYAKSRRGPKRPPPPKGPYRNGGHVATHRLLQQREAAAK